MEAFGNCVRSDIAGRPDPNVALKEDFFAITIGINRYLYEPNLHGAVGDADRLRDWLVTDHGVPIENIINLRDKEATGAKIRGALRGLVENKRIRPNNIVLFYFAGHGSTADAPESWQVSDNLIQMILPSDFDRDLSSAEGNEV
ncbi:hypothetical protein H0H93_014817 [Arthromyces matolae]|nr:hypothetical protein H0H93_014817 [Arthromyces matolae]